MATHNERSLRILHEINTMVSLLESNEEIERRFGSEWRRMFDMMMDRMVEEL